MKVFKEFLLEDTCTEQNIYLPAGTEIVGVANTDLGVVLVAITAHTSFDSAAPELRTIKICANDEIFTGSIVRYLGSYKSDLGARHVIELKKEL